MVFKLIHLCYKNTVYNTIKVNLISNAINISRKPINKYSLCKFKYLIFIPKYNYLSRFCRQIYKHTKNVHLKGPTLLCFSFFGPSMFTKDDDKSFSKKSLVTTEDSSLRGRRKSGIFDKLLFSLYESLCLFIRALQLIFTFTPILMLFPMKYLGTQAEEFWWKILLIGIEYSGPIFIKFGQWASTRRDLFPETFCNQFSRLQRRSKPHSWHYTKQQLEKAFGKHWRKIFVKFDNNANPIGSGCVAQVYKVWINEDQVKSHDVLEEIIKEYEDSEEDRIGLVDDGLEVLGFRNWLINKTKETVEEQEAISEFKKDREMKRLLKLAEMEEQERIKSRSSSETQDIKAVTQELVGEILQGEKSKEVKSQTGNNDDDDSNNAQTESNHNPEHALVEQWQISPESLEKSLPLSGDLEEDFEGLVPVALKVLHPGVYRTFTRDMYIMRSMASFITIVYPPLKWLNLEECMEEFFKVMSAQIDMRKEADNLERFIDSFMMIETVRFPRPVRPFVTRRVLVETYEEGEPMVNFITEDKPEALKKNLAKIGVDTLLKMIFNDNLIHGDLHPGNILVQNETSSLEPNNNDGNDPKIMMVDIGGDTFVMNVVEDPKPLRLCILDCGIVARLKPKDLDNFKAVFKQVILGEGESVADLFLEQSEHSCIDPDAFRSDMTELVRNARSNVLCLEQVDVGILLQRVLGLLLKHRIRLESAFSSVVLAVFVLEGLGRSLDPEMDILERARPLLIP